MKVNPSEQLYLQNKYPKEMVFFRFIYKWMRITFEKIYESKYNPVTNAGTLAVLFLGIAILSGFYLVFFYKLSTPYESIVAMQNNVVFIRWVRAIHRYASDGAVVAILFHMLKMLAQGRSWGPRFLSWITGVIMTGFLFFSAYTGYVLVWDEHAKIIGILGVKIMDIFPVMPESLLRTFSGEEPPGENFFFLIIFLHLAVPLGMVFGVWLHTSRISRPKYFFNRNIAIIITVLFIIVSVIIPAPLPVKADLFSISLDFPLDAFYSFFIYFSDIMKPSGLALLLLGFNVLLFIIPWYWKPSLKISKVDYISMVDIDLCQGCRQCYYDCPFDAIDMVVSEKMRLKELIGKAESSMNPVINSVKCVSCGLCAASCVPFAIGPKDRTGKDLLNRIREMEHPVQITKNTRMQNESQKKYFIFGCIHNDLTRLPVSREDSYYFPVSCAGTIHSSHLHHVARHYEKTIVISCLESNCTFRQGPAWLHERISGLRDPGLTEKKDKENIIWLYDSKNLSLRIAEESLPILSRKTTGISWKIFRKTGEVVFALLLISGIAGISRLPVHQDHDSSLLKLSWKMQGERIEKCREYTPGELQKIPIHMRKQKLCEINYLPYTLKINMDGKEITKSYKPGGYRKDRPLLVYEEIILSPGEHSLSIDFSPVPDASVQLVSTGLLYQDKIFFNKDKVVLITMANGKFIKKDTN